MVKAYHIGFVIKQKLGRKMASDQKELCKGICDSFKPCRASNEENMSHPSQPLKCFFRGLA